MTKELFGYQYTKYKCIGLEWEKAGGGCGSRVWEQQVGEYEHWLYCCLCDITIKDDYGDREVVQGFVIPESYQQPRRRFVLPKFSLPKLDIPLYPFGRYEVEAKPKEFYPGENFMVKLIGRGCYPWT